MPHHKTLSYSEVAHIVYLYLPSECWHARFGFICHHFTPQEVRCFIIIRVANFCDLHEVTSHYNCSRQLNVGIHKTVL